jgi:hypothetical protein
MRDEAHCFAKWGSDVAKRMAFLFLDECTHESLDLAALTGVLVPLREYTAVRDAVCQIVWDVLLPPPNTVPAPIELHARDLLSELSNRDRQELDRARLHVFSTVVRIVNEHRLHVFRVAYLNRGEIATVCKGDPKLYGLNFFGIQNALDPILAETIVLPVMDGVPGCAPDARRPPAIDPQLIRAFAQQVRWIHHARRDDAIAQSLSIKNAGNLAEPVFGDSEHSTLLQLTDILSHLLLQLEREELETPSPPSDYRAGVLAQARKLDPDLLHCWKGRMRIWRDGYKPSPPES